MSPIISYIVGAPRMLGFAIAQLCLIAMFLVVPSFRPLDVFVFILLAVASYFVSKLIWLSAPANRESLLLGHLSRPTHWFWAATFYLTGAIAIRVIYDHEAFSCEAIISLLFAFAAAKLGCQRVGCCRVAGRPDKRDLPLPLIEFSLALTGALIVLTLLLQGYPPTIAYCTGAACLLLTRTISLIAQTRPITHLAREQLSIFGTTILTIALPPPGVSG